MLTDGRTSMKLKDSLKNEGPEFLASWHFLARDFAKDGRNLPQLHIPSFCSKRNTVYRKAALPENDQIRCTICCVPMAQLVSALVITIGI